MSHRRQVIAKKENCSTFFDSPLATPLFKLTVSSPKAATNAGQHFLIASTASWSDNHLTECGSLTVTVQFIISCSSSRSRLYLKVLNYIGLTYNMPVWI